MSFDRCGAACQRSSRRQLRRLCLFAASLATLRHLSLYAAFPKIRSRLKSAISIRVCNGIINRSAASDFLRLKFVCWSGFGVNVRLMLFVSRRALSCCENCPTGVGVVGRCLPLWRSWSLLQGVPAPGLDPTPSGGLFVGPPPEAQEGGSSCSACSCGSRVQSGGGRGQGQGGQGRGGGRGRDARPLASEDEEVEVEEVN